jgi:ribosomal protein S18 acetylase RimI-like enzyme
MITTMNQNMLELIRVLDNECFKKGDNYRSIENLSELLSNNPDGCFVIRHENKIVGYIFSRVLGNVGFIGPLGINPALRGKGFGKAIVNAGRDALIKAGCVSIGLEVLPELGNNIGLYQSVGFTPTFSTITYRKKVNYEIAECDNMVNGKELDIRKISLFDEAFCDEHCGYSLLQDILSAKSHADSSLFFYQYNDALTGFLCYSPLINPFLWGALLHDHNHKDVFEALFSKIETSNQNVKLKIRINSRYTKALNMIDNSFEAERSILRMMLNGYEGEYMSLDKQSFIAYSWVG